MRAGEMIVHRNLKAFILKDLKGFFTPRVRLLFLFGSLFQIKEDNSNYFIIIIIIIVIYIISKEFTEQYCIVIFTVTIIKMTYRDKRFWPDKIPNSLHVRDVND